jgi:hypothetical protein
VGSSLGCWLHQRHVRSAYRHIHLVSRQQLPPPDRRPAYRWPEGSRRAGSG